jgi:hypothetical protein
MSGLNRDQINKLIFDNELFHGVLTGMGVVMDIEHLEKFVALVAAAERETCAELVSDLGDAEDDGEFFRILKDAAIAIRARNKNAA